MSSMIRRIVLALAAVILLLGASSAHADTILNYQISGPGPNGTFNASFNLPQNPTPSNVFPFGLGFDFTSLPVDVNGKWTNLTMAFYSSSILGGGLGSNTFALFGSQLFSWPSTSSTPIMNMGIFQLSGVAGNTLGLGSNTYTVSVTDPPAPVPEPASFILLGTGVLTLLGLHLLRRSA